MWWWRWNASTALYLNVYPPRLQYPAGVAAFFVGVDGLVESTKGQRKDDVVHEYLAELEAIGRAQGVPFSRRRKGSPHVPDREAP